MPPDDWSLPTGKCPEENTNKGYISRLTELVNKHYNDPNHNPAIPFVAWGYHGLWHRSFHELIANDAALKLLKVDKALTIDHHEVDWDKGYQLHAHTNGDGSAKELINLVRRLQAEHPRTDHRTTLEHFAYATEAQIKQMKALGMMVSATPYYQYILADIYANQWLGEDRAIKMVPLGTAKKHGLPITLHLNAPMAPLSPLTLAWTAVNRVTINGKKNIAGEKLTVDEALRAITIDAAWTMRREDKIGSIVAGKCRLCYLRARPVSGRP